jgi:hypothetical protein
MVLSGWNRYVGEPVLVSLGVDMEMIYGAARMRETLVTLSDVAARLSHDSIALTNCGDVECAREVNKALSQTLHAHDYVSQHLRQTHKDLITGKRDSVG